MSPLLSSISKAYQDLIKGFRYPVFSITLYPNIIQLDEIKNILLGGIKQHLDKFPSMNYTPNSPISWIILKHWLHC